MTLHRTHKCKRARLPIELRSFVYKDKKDNMKEKRSYDWCLKILHLNSVLSHYEMVPIIACPFCGRKLAIPK